MSSSGYQRMLSEDGCQGFTVLWELRPKEIVLHGGGQNTDGLLPEAQGTGKDGGQPGPLPSSHDALFQECLQLVDFHSDALDNGVWAH